MPVTVLKSLDDDRLDPFRQLKETNATRRAGLFITEGDKLLERLLASDYEVASILLDQRQFTRFEPLLPADVPVYVIPGELVESLVGYNFHRGALGCGRRKPVPSVAEFLHAIGSSTPLPVRDGAGEGRAKPAENSPVAHGLPPSRRLLLVVGWEVQNPENVGALLRLSAALGVDALALGPGCADPLSRRVLRVSMGAALRVPLLRVENLAAELVDWRTRYELTSLAAVLDETAVPLDQAQRPPRGAILFGSEGHGLPPEIVAACDQKVWIPMAPGTDSLNVAMAAGIVLYHFTR